MGLIFILGLITRAVFFDGDHAIPLLHFLRKLNQFIKVFSAEGIPLLYINSFDKTAGMSHIVEYLNSTE